MKPDNFFKKLKGIKSINAKYSKTEGEEQGTKTNTEYNVNVKREWMVYVMFLILVVICLLISYFFFNSKVDSINEKLYINERLSTKLDSVSNQIKNSNKEITLTVHAKEFVPLVKSWKNYTDFEKEIVKREYAFQIIKMSLISILWICMLVAFYLIVKSNNKEDRIDKW